MSVASAWFSLCLLSWETSIYWLSKLTGTFALRTTWLQSLRLGSLFSHYFTSSRNRRTITLKMVDKGKSDFCVVFTVSLCALELKQNVNNVCHLKSFEAIWNWLVNMSFISYQIQKLAPQRIMVKTTWRSYHPWSAIFSVIVYWQGCLVTRRVVYLEIFWQ